jgi:histidine phosphotransfer protein HptB
MSRSVNTERIREVAFDDEAFMKELVSLYLGDAETQLEVLARAIAADDPAEAEGVAHRLKGSSGNLGAEQLAELLGHLEREAHNGQARGLEQVLDAVHEEFGRVRAFLKEWDGVKR